MRLIKEGQYVGKTCAWCANPAKWRANRLGYAKYACDGHRADLQAQEATANADDHLSEGDWQSWGRI